MATGCAGVDSSTQSTKVEVREPATGAVVASASAPHPATTPPRSEQHPDAWWEAFTQAWSQVGAPEVAAISVAGQQHGMVVLDADRRVVRPAKLWNDTESAPDAGWLIKQLAGGRAEWAASGGQRAGGVDDVDQAVVVASQRARALAADGPRACCRTTG